MQQLNTIKRDVTTGHLPPWRQLINLTIDKVHLKKPKEHCTEEEFYNTLRQKIGTIQADVRIFTDGSTIQEETKRMEEMESISNAQAREEYCIKPSSQQEGYALPIVENV